MKQTLLAALMTAALTASATAGGMAFYVPNLTFPPTDNIVVSEDCLTQTDATQTCIPQE